MRTELLARDAVDGDQLPAGVVVLAAQQSHCGTCKHWGRSSAPPPDFLGSPIGARADPMCRLYPLHRASEHFVRIDPSIESADKSLVGHGSGR